MVLSISMIWMVCLLKSSMDFKCFELGNAPAQKLFKLVKVEKICGDAPPRSFADYSVSVGDAPDGVEAIEML